MKIVLVTNIPSPYRVIVYDEIALKYGEDFHVIYCAAIEKNRKWKLPEIRHQHTFLKAKRIGKTIYYKSDVLKQLRRQGPDIIIIAGFNPVSLAVRIYAILKKIRTIEYTDSWIDSIKQLSIFHKKLRRISLKYVDACICASTKGREYLVEYGVFKEKVFISPLVINNLHFKPFLNCKKDFHLMFSGQFVAGKLPFFVVDVCNEVKKVIPALRILLIGDGPLKEPLIQSLLASGINFEYPGFIQQNELPMYYSKAKILLFPTLRDSWGIVANEAFAAGMPVITCKNAGVSNELVIDNHNGYILPLDAKCWSEKIIELLQDENKYKRFSENCLSQVDKYTVHEACNGFVKAIEFIDEKK